MISDVWRTLENLPEYLVNLINNTQLFLSIDLLVQPASLTQNTLLSQLITPCDKPIQTTFTIQRFGLHSILVVMAPQQASDTGNMKEPSALTTIEQLRSRLTECLAISDHIQETLFQEYDEHNEIRTLPSNNFRGIMLLLKAITVKFKSFDQEVDTAIQSLRRIQWYLEGLGPIDNVEDSEDTHDEDQAGEESEVDSGGADSEVPPQVL